MICYGIDLKSYNADSLRKSKRKDQPILANKKCIMTFRISRDFFNAYFTKLAGTEQLRKQIEQMLGEEQIRKSWEPALSAFKTVRKKYLCISKG